MKNQIIDASICAEIEQFRGEYPAYRAVLSQRFTFCESWLILAKSKSKEDYSCFWWHVERGIFKILAIGTREECKKVWAQTRDEITANVINHRVSKQMGVVLCK